MADPPSTVPQSSAPEGTAATTNAHIPELPNEVLYSIAGFVDDAGIPNLRLAAKVFHYITAERFATVFFQDRAYELSPAGLKALVKITEHPVFAPYIRTIIIGHGGKHHSAEYHDKMESAFQNLKVYGHKISLGLRRVRTAHNFEVRPYCVGTAMSKFSEKMISAAKKAQMPIESIIADLQNPLLGERSKEWYYLFLHALNGNEITAFHIKLSSHGPTFAASKRVSFIKSHRRLELSRTTPSIEEAISAVFPSIALELHLSDCEVSGALMAKLLSHSSQLKHISFRNVHLVMSSDSLGHWGRVFIYLFGFRIASLESCEFGNLWHGRDSLWLEGGDKTIRAKTRGQVYTVMPNLAAGLKESTLDV
ncbi:hypothetical protein D6C91_08488 [Aureobasidium pullulans]|uniref:F-box domain-containing protein n=1 Tax=Aureobasidium pullulans TaxID=5580 RepID=A0A4S9SL49_AURPU|nr:hypothetical protein D6C91_08488 [Aureobasidium pullulans]